MIELNVTNLVGGNIVITTSSSGGGGGSEGGSRTATRVWYGDDNSVYTDYEITGTITGSGDANPTSQIPNVTSAKKIEIGSIVTSIGDCAFRNCSNLTLVKIPNNVTSIGVQVFENCYNLTSVFFEGKDNSTVQGMSCYPFGINYSNENGVSIYCVTDEDGAIEIVIPYDG